MDMKQGFLLACIVGAFLIAPASAGDTAWFDMENCSMCKHLGGQAGLMENMTWEQHNFSQGTVAVTRVNTDYLETYRTAHAAMMKTGDQLMQGHQLPLCGSCNAVGACFMKGAKQDYIETADGDIWVVSSVNPELVAEIHAWVERNQKEMQKMMGKS
jgi:hypothetical protein